MRKVRNMHKRIILKFFFETSAKSNTNIELAFLKTTEILHQKYKSKKIDITPPDNNLRFSNKVSKVEKKPSKDNVDKGCCT